MSDRFRKVYRPLNHEEVNAIDSIKDKAAELEQVILLMPESREKSLAITKLEESVMWAIKAITG